MLSNLSLNMKILYITIFILLFTGLFFVLDQSHCYAEEPKLKIPQPKITIPGMNQLKGVSDCGDRVCVPWIAEYIAGVYRYSVGIVGILATVVMMLGGFIWITAGGNPSRVGEAKAWIGGALTGLLLMLTSYTLLYQVNPDLVAMRALPVKTIKPGDAVPARSDYRAPGSDALISGQQLTHEDASRILTGQGMRIKTWGDPASLEGLRADTIQELLEASVIIGPRNMIITSGTDGEMHKEGACSHYNGCKVDLSMDPTMTRNLESSSEFNCVGTWSNGTILYQRSGGGCWAKESTHWDVSTQPCRPTNASGCPQS
jgi:hypothetical protein